MSGKKFTDALKGFDRDQFYTPTEALGIVKTVAKGGFDESVDVSVRLGVDPRKADQMVRGTVALPSGTGKDVRVAVFASGEAAAEAREAGADLVGADDLAAQVEAGKFDFDVAIATPDMMPLVGRLGRALGPRGLMPNPKTGTVTNDVGRAVTEFKGGKVEYRTDRYGNVHVPFGKVSFEPTDLETNFRAVLDELQRARPASAKGRYLRKITVSSTQGPGVRVDTGRLRPVECPGTVLPTWRRRCVRPDFGGCGRKGAGELRASGAGCFHYTGGWGGAWSGDVGAVPVGGVDVEGGEAGGLQRGAARPTRWTWRLPVSSGDSADAVEPRGALGWRRAAGRGGSGSATFAAVRAASMQGCR